MKELEETHCEVRKIIDIQLSIWDRLNNSGGDELGPSVGSPTIKSPAAPLGGFLEAANYVWLSCGPRFMVLNIRTAESIASWTFRDRVTSVAQFPAQPGQIPLLLVGLDNGATKVKDSAGMICIFDCTTSRVLRAIRVPAGVEQICVMDGGAEWEDFNEKRTNTILSKNSGTACVTLRNLYHIAVDLRRPLWDGDGSRIVMDESCPTEVEFLMTNSSKQHYDKGKHMAHNLLSSSIEEYLKFNRDKFEMEPVYYENLTSAIVNSRKIGCLFLGCLGRIIIWKEDGSIGWISPPTKENMAISHFALLEPTDDPRPFYYLWVVYQEKSSQMAPILRMYAMLFERKYCDKGTNLYFNLEAEPSLKFELELEDDDEVTSISPVERNSSHEQSETNSKRGEESLLLISINGRALLFDLNQWYKEQMPRTVGECQNPNTFLVSYQMRPEAQGMTEDTVLNCAYIPSSLREFPSNGGNSPEELFYPNALSLEWVELGIGRLTFWLTRGSQWELLREMAVAGPSVLIQPSETFHRCLAAGLMPLNTECSFSSDQNAQREMLLSLCLEQRWATFLIRCAKEWADGSVSYLFPAFLRWGAQRASSIKMAADQLCVPLFDQSGSSIGETEMKMLRFCSQQLECLSNVVATLPIASSDLVKQQRALRRVATYLQVLLWFYDVGLLPETPEMDEERLPINFTPQIPYPYERLSETYKDKREQAKKGDANGNECEEDLFIDELMTRECRSLRSQWEKEGGDITIGGYYPPPSLQSLLRSYLVDCHRTTSDEMENKHQITIYLLMDLAKLLQSSCPGVEQLIKYPSAFKMSPSLIKLTQAFWLLDHEDYPGFLDMLTGQLVSDSDVKDWHHRLVVRTLMRNNEYKLALTYLRMRKPPLSAIGDQGTGISLSVERGLVQAAFHQRPPSHYKQLLGCFFEACKARNRLSEILQLALDPEEEIAFVKFLEEGKCEETKLLYYLQRCRYTEASNVHPFGLNRAHQKSGQSAPLTMINAYNGTLPEVTRQFSTNLSRRQVEVDPESRYPRPMSHCRSYNKSQGIYDTVVKKARETYVRGERCQIPFVSAPCDSLKFGINNTNSTCVLFPVLARKAPGKRTLDQMQEDEEEVKKDYLEERKRRRISAENDSLDKSATRELGISVAFDTPLVQRRRQIANAPGDTPHSILKIRQLIRGSKSPGTRSRAPEKKMSEERDKKPMRQIRFSVGQPMNDSNNEESVDDEPEEVKNNASEESEDAFYSPNASGKSHSSSSTFSSIGISGPRPRPGLRRSSPLVNESLIELEKSLPMNRTSTGSVKDTASPTSTDCGINSTKTTTDSTNLVKAPPITPRTRPSLLEATCYSSGILSSDSSFQSTPASSPPVPRTSQGSLKQRRDSLGNSQRISSKGSDDGNLQDESLDGKRKLLSMGFSKSVHVSHSTVTKTTVIEEFNDDETAKYDEEVIMEVDDFGLDHEPDVCLMDAKQIERRLFGETDATERQDSSGTRESEQSLKEQERREDGILSESQQNESECFGEGRNRQEEVVFDLDDYEDELLVLKDKEEDDNEEYFQSLTNSRNSALGKVKEALIETPNVLGEDSNITEDESSEDEEVRLVVEEPDTETKTSEDSPKEVEAGETASERRQSKSDDGNFTEDDSVSSNSSEIGKCIAGEPREPSGVEEKQEGSKKDASMESIRSFANSVNENSTLREAKSPGRSLYRSRYGDVTDNLEYFDSPATPDPNDVTDDLEKFHKIRRQGSIRNSGTSSAGNDDDDDDDVFLDSVANSAVSKISTKAMASTSGSETGRTLEEKTNVRMTRARRASSIAKDVPASSETPKSQKLGRTRRASSLAKEATEVESESPEETAASEKQSRARRSTSLAKEVILSLVRLEETSDKVASPLRRSTRRAASVQKEMPVIPEVRTRRRKTSTSSSVSKESLIEEAEPVAKKATRARRGASVTKESESTMPTRSTRSSSVAKETVREEEDAKKKTTRRRGGSVSKETVDTTRLEEEAEDASKKTTRKRGSSVSKEAADTTGPRPRATRAGSIGKEMVKEKGSTESLVETRRGRASSLSTSIEKKAVYSPARKTKTRSSSVQSIPEEMEDILSSTARGKSSSLTDEENQPTREATRGRRAASMEPSRPEPKRKARRVLAKSTLVEEIIEEALNEDETERRPKTKATRSTIPRKRTDSATSSKDDEDATEKPRKGRRGSELKNERRDFLFSLPEVNSPPPNDQQEVGEVPSYVFSPPQTRSKHITASQHRN